MDYLKIFIDLFLHLDKHLIEITNEYGTLVYLLLFIIVFCETGLVIAPFLPGDSLLFATGALVATGALDLSTIFILLCFAAILGDNVNYRVGHFLRNRISSNENIRFVKKEYLIRTQNFYEKHGVKTIILARFVPVIRTFSPFVAGVGKMHYPRFLGYDILGGILWVGIFLLGGYFFGNLPFIKNNFSFVILGIIFVSLLPGIITYVQSKKDTSRA